MNKRKRRIINRRQDNKKHYYDNSFTGINVSIVLTIPILVLIAACGVVLILYSTIRYGSAITHDSVAYVYAADSLLNGKGMLYFGYESPFIQWPPLFPLVLSGLKSMGVDLISVSPYINGILYALISLISGLWVYNSTKRSIFAIMTSLALSASIPLYHVFRFMWSEPLFIFFTLLFLISLSSHVNNINSEALSGKKTSIKYLVITSVFASLACLTRYMGLTLIITGVIILLFLQKKKALKRLQDTILFGIISSAPTFVWVIRNFILTGTLTGGRVPSQKGLAENVELFFETIALWISPVYSRNMSYFILGAIIFVAIIIIFACKANLLPEDCEKDCTNVKNNGDKIAILLVFIVIYSAYMLFSASKVSIDSINNRLLSPIYVPLILLIILTIANYFKIKLGKNRKISSVFYSMLTVILYFSWIIYPFSHIREEAGYYYKNGEGILASVWWRNSPTIRYVKELPSETVICSNSSDAVYIHSGKVTRYPPKKDGIHWYGIDQFIKFVENYETVYIVWFNRDEGETIYDVDDLREYFEIEMVAELYDSTIYRIEE